MSQSLLCRAVRVVTKSGEEFVRVYLGRTKEGVHQFGGLDVHGRRFVQRFAGTGCEVVSVTPISTQGVAA